MDRSSEKVLLGHLTGVYGLRGWVKVHSDTSPRENIVGFGQWWLEKAGNGQWLKVLDGRPQGKTIVAQLAGISSPEQAGMLTGSTISVERSAMPVLQAGEYYWSDLIGMDVCTIDGIAIGPVTRLFETGANDVVVVHDLRESTEHVGGGEADVKLGGKSREILVPWLVPDVITDIDKEKNVITIDWDPDF